MALALPPDVQALLERHFQSRWGHWAPQDHLETWAPEALLLGPQGEVRARMGWPEAPLLAHWAQLPPSAYLPGDRPDGLITWEGQVALRLPLRPRQADEAQPEGGPWGLWLGLEEGPAGWGVRWASLRTEAPGSWAEGLFGALAEFSGLGALAQLQPGLSGADLAWARLSWLPKQRLMALPETRFQCQGRGHCCEDSLTIGLDAASAAFLEAAPLAELLPELGPGPHLAPLSETAAALAGASHQLLRRPDGRCHFLDDQRRCMLHRLAGRALFKPCHVFPYRFAWTPDGVAVTTLASCPTARAGQGPPLASLERDVRSRLQVSELLRPEGFWLGPGQELPWTEWAKVEGQLLEILNQEGPLKARLAAATLWVARRCQDPEAALNPAWLAQAPPRLGWFKRWALDRYVKLFDRCFDELHRLPKGQLRWAEAEEELARFHRSQLFSKRFSYPFGLQGGVHALCLTHRILERQAQRFGPDRLSEAFWREAYGVLTIGTFPRLLQVVHRTPATGFANMLGQPGFGVGLLSL